MPENWNRNLWYEFYGLLHRREIFDGYRQMLEASSQEAQSAARWLTQVFVRNYVETQAMAIRRLANSGKDTRVISLGRILREISEQPEVLGSQIADEAKRDFEAIQASADNVTTFANKVVAHLDRDHATAVPALTIGDIHDVVNFIGQLWERWYVRVTGNSASAEPPAAGGTWWEVLKLERIEQPWERALREYKLSHQGLENPGGQE